MNTTSATNNANPGTSTDPATCEGLCGTQTPSTASDVASSATGDSYSTSGPSGVPNTTPSSDIHAVEQLFRDAQQALSDGAASAMRYFSSRPPEEFSQFAQATTEILVELGFEESELPPPEGEPIEWFAKILSFLFRVMKNLQKDAEKKMEAMQAGGSESLDQETLKLKEVLDTIKNIFALAVQMQNTHAESVAKVNR